MKISKELSDDAVLKELGQRISRRRLNRNQTREELAMEAGVSSRTLARIEHGESGQTTNLIRILRALDLLDQVEALMPESVPSPIQQLKLHGKTRQRATAKSHEAEKEGPWTWGDDA